MTTVGNGRIDTFMRECVLNVSCPSEPKPQLAPTEEITHEYELERYYPRKEDALVVVQKVERLREGFRYGCFGHRALVYQLPMLAPLPTVLAAKSATGAKKSQFSE